MKLTRRKFVERLALGTTLLTGGVSSAAANSAQRSSSSAKKLRPNIKFILADDLGWGDRETRCDRANGNTFAMARFADSSIYLSISVSRQILVTRIPRS